MNLRNVYLFPFALVGLLLTMAQTSRALQHSGSNSREWETEIKCSTPVMVTGAVVAPSRFELQRRVRLKELLAMTGGLTERAGKTVEITRARLGSNCQKLATDDSNKESESVELYDLTGLLRGIGDTNPYVQPGDIVTVPGAGVVYIVGNVLQPQSLLLKTPITVRQAIAMVGGVLKDSLTDRVFICRSSLHSVEATLITVDLKAIKNGRAEDIALQPYDIVEVRGKRKNYPATPLYKKIILPEEKELPLRIIN